MSDPTAAMLAECDRIKLMKPMEQRAAFERIEKAEGRHKADAMRFIVMSKREPKQ